MKICRLLLKNLFTFSQHNIFSILKSLNFAVPVCRDNFRAPQGFVHGLRGFGTRSPSLFIERRTSRNADVPVCTSIIKVYCHKVPLRTCNGHIFILISVCVSSRMRPRGHSYGRGNPERGRMGPPLWCINRRDAR